MKLQACSQTACYPLLVKPHLDMNTFHLGTNILQPSILFAPSPTTRSQLLVGDGGIRTEGWGCLCQHGLFMLKSCIERNCDSVLVHG